MSINKTGLDKTPPNKQIYCQNIYTTMPNDLALAWNVHYVSLTNMLQSDRDNNNHPIKFHNFKSFKINIDITLYALICTSEKQLWAIINDSNMPLTLRAAEINHTYLA